MCYIFLTYMTLFIFGGTGDLARRKIIPAFSALRFPNLKIIALGRREFTDKMYRDFICNDKCFAGWEKKPRYEKVDFDGEIKCEECSSHLRKGEKNYFYSALPPKTYPALLRYLGKIKKSGYPVRALIEKPFGENIRGAKELEKISEKENLTDDLFISDHYLFKEEIIKLRKKDFKRIRIVSLEEVGLEGRIGYYDEMGALKDMVQSHFLNIVFKLLINPEKEFGNFEVAGYERGQYGEYEKELGRKSSTETFVRLSLQTKERRYEFITGKGFNKKLSYLEVDGEKIILASGRNAYERLFADFFAGRKENFATISGSILGWRIVEKAKRKKPGLKYYKKGISFLG